MRLAINARFLTQPLSGVQRYARELLRALDRRLMQDDTLRAALGPVVAYAPKGVSAPPDWQVLQLQVLPGGQGGHHWEQQALYRATKDAVLLGLGNSGPVRHSRQVLALHDANLWRIPEAYSLRYRLLHKSLRPVLARRAAGLITVSRFSAQELAQVLGVPASRFCIVPNAAEHILSCKADCYVLPRHGLEQGGYLLCVGNQSPNKNIARLVAAHRLAGPEVPPLVVAGCAAPGLADAAPDSVIALGRVSDGALRALYEGAAGFVFPSLYEGFGIPPLEAMEMGCPVLAARASALPEVLGEAPLWFHPEDTADMACTLRDFARMDFAARNRLIRAGRDQAARYRWSRSVEALLPVLMQAGAGVPVVQAAPPSDRVLVRRKG